MKPDEQISLARALQEPLALVEKPFEQVAVCAGLTEHSVLEQIRDWVSDGTIRRFGARINHRTVGYTANGMSVWKVCCENADAAGRFMASLDEVSHCYLRKTAPGWEYNLYAMIHGRSEREVLDLAARISSETAIKEYEVLFSRKEFKKCTPRLFPTEKT